MFSRYVAPLVLAGVRRAPAAAKPLLLRPRLPAFLPRPAVAGNRAYSTPINKIDKPTYQLTFTCKACDHRSSHLVSKQAYHQGTVLIQCPSCRNRHLIADHLNVFGQGKKTLEDILRERGSGETVTKSTIDLNKIGDLEWEGPDEPPLQVATEEKK